MTRDEIRTRVLAKLDEIEVMAGADQSPTDVLINILMDESALLMLRNAPLHLLRPEKVDVSSSNTNLTQTINEEEGIGSIVLPSDFLRLYSFKMKAWKRPVTDVISIANPLYDKQKNRATRGGINKPVVVINYHESSAGISDYLIEDTPPEVNQD